MPEISIIIPCRNEEKYIARCLDSLSGQDYPKEKMEILAVDGMSEDKTKEILESYRNKYPFLAILKNERKVKPVALNIGIREAKGEIVVIADAHAFYEKDYVSKSVKYLKEYKADNVGGIIKTIPTKDNLVARAITICLSHPFGVGGSYFRVGSERFRWVDTVFGGCYRKEVFDKIGFFNENLVRSQDLEFNLRLKKAGGKILLASDIVSYYYPKSEIKDFFVHNLKDGFWAIYPLKFTKISFRPRHYLPLIFILTLPFSFWFYLPVLLYFSVDVAFSRKEAGYLFLMPLVFSSRHIGYGLGSLWGLTKSVF